MGTVSFRGVTMGWREDRDIRIERIGGVDALVTSASTQWLPEHHQGVPVGGWMRDEDISLRVRLFGDLNQRRREIAQAFTPDTADPTREWPLELDLDTGEQWTIMCRPAGRSSERTRLSEIVGPTVLLQLMRTDPITYGAQLRTATLTPFVGVGFAEYPANASPDNRVFGEYPKLYTGGGSGGGVQVTNQGWIPVWPRFTIDGPDSGTMNVERLENATTGHVMQFTANGGLQIPAGQTAVVEMHPSRTLVRFLTGVDRLNTVVDLDSWWQLQPGVQDLRLRASGDVAGAEALVEWRDGYS